MPKDTFLERLEDAIASEDLDARCDICLRPSLSPCCKQCRDTEFGDPSWRETSY